jgi:hypothetical protein
MPGQATRTLTKSVTRIGVNNLSESLECVRGITFQPDRIEIQLISDEVTVRKMILILDLVVSGINKGFPYIMRVNLLEEYAVGNDNAICTRYDERRYAITIMLPGVISLTFGNGKESRSFPK